LARRRALLHAKFHPIGATCSPVGRKTSKLASELLKYRRVALRAMLPVMIKILPMHCFTCQQVTCCCCWCVRMDDNSCMMKLIEIVPVDNNSNCSESADVRLSPCHVKVCTQFILIATLFEFNYLWSPYGIGQTIIFSSCGFFFFFFLFFPRLISAVAD